MQFLCFVSRCTSVVGSGSISLNNLAASTVSTSDSVSTITTIAQMISDFGIQLVISSIMVFFIYRYLKSVLKRDNSVFETIKPKLEEISSDISKMGTDINKLVSNHNSHSNQMLRVLEKNQDDIRDLILEQQNQTRTIMAQLSALQSNIEIMLRMIAACNNFTTSRTLSNGNAEFDTQPHLEESADGILDKPDSDDNTKN
jgi:gas vesicle protein